MYNPFKDVFKGRRQDIKDLEDRINKLILCLMSIHSWNEGMDRSLRRSVFKVESAEYTEMKAEISIINKMYINLLKKYIGITRNQFSSSTELNATTVYSMVELLNYLKSKTLTFSFLKLAKLNRDITKLTRTAGKVLDRLRLPENMIKPVLEPNQDWLDDGGDDVLPVFNEYVAQVLEYLQEGRNEVGISGLKGVGKTTVLRKVYTRLIGSKGNGIVIWIDYPPDEAEINENDIIEKLQNEMMEQLEIHHEASSSIAKNANTISAFLHEKRYILLMDNVSAFVDLDKVGLREFHEHKKVVIGSREKKVIRRMTEHEINIGRLDTDDAWILFENMSGKLYDSSKKAIAGRIIENCEGIPGMISAVAKYLKDKKDDSSWNYAKEILQSRSKSLGFDKIDEIKYQVLPIDTKQCLLYGALFPPKYRIDADYLIECWIAEGFINEIDDQKVRLNRERGQTILNYLTDEGLLQWYSGKKYVTMPLDFRKVALALEFPGKEKGAIWVPSEDRMPDEKTWATVTRMSLIGCKTELPQSPQCPNLSTLLLQSIYQDRETLPYYFFIHMESLQILNLSDTEIRALPNSIIKLVNLKSLYLNGCFRLEALPSEAANLVKLEFLDICGTSIPTLPIEIRWMVKMRCLRATLSPTGIELEEIIAPGIISNLRNLEELSIITAFDFGISVAHRLAEELATLEHLNTLCFNFPDMSSLNTFVTRSKALNNMETRWGTSTFRSFSLKKILSYEPEFLVILAERWLRYSTNEEFSPACQQLLNQASAFEIIGHDDLKSFSAGKFDLHSVKVCVVERCRHLQNIMDGEEDGFFQVNLLKKLEELYLHDLEQLQCIWHGPVHPTGLINLTAITIKGCHKLTEIIGPALASSLRNLEYLKVDDCRQISKIYNRDARWSF